MQTASHSEHFEEDGCRLCQRSARLQSEERAFEIGHSSRVVLKRHKGRSSDWRLELSKSKFFFELDLNLPFVVSPRFCPEELDLEHFALAAEQQDFLLILIEYRAKDEFL